MGAASLPLVASRCFYDNRRARGGDETKHKGSIVGPVLLSRCYLELFLCYSSQGDGRNDKATVLGAVEFI